MGDWGIFNDIKDAGLNRLLTPLINNQIKEYGSLSEFKIDSKNKDIQLRLMLKGEEQLITVSLHKYEIIKSGAESYITFQSITADRKWISLIIKNELLPRIAPGNRYPLPAELAAFIIRFI